MLFLIFAIALAQTPPDEGPAGRANRRVVTNAELVNMLDTYAIVQAQEALELPDKTYGEFVARLKRLQQSRRRNTQGRNQIIQQLRRLTQDASADENALRARLQALHDHEVRALADLRRAYEALDELLSPRQQARFRILEERLERQKLDLLMRIRNRPGTAKAPPGR